MDNCRAGGDTLAFDLRPGNQAIVTDSTLTGEGGCLLIAGCALNQACNGSESLLLCDNVFQGHSVFFSPSQDTCFAWYDDEPPDDLLPSNPFHTEHSIITLKDGHNNDVTPPRYGDDARFGRARVGRSSGSTRVMLSVT